YSVAAASRLPQLRQLLCKEGGSKPTLFFLTGIAAVLDPPAPLHASGEQDQMRLARIAAGITLLFMLAGLLAAAPYRLNRASDSALSLYIDNDVSAAADTEGNLHLVYTDSAVGNRIWQIYYRSLKD